MASNIRNRFATSVAVMCAFQVVVSGGSREQGVGEQSLDAHDDDEIMSLMQLPVARRPSQNNSILREVDAIDTLAVPSKASEGTNAQPVATAAHAVSDASSKVNVERSVPPSLVPTVVEAQPMATLVTAYLCTMAFVGCAIVVIYYPQGASAIIGILLYVLSLATMKLAVKHVFVDYSLQYPQALTALHLGFSSLLGFAILFYRRFQNQVPVPVPTFDEFFYRILPIGLGFGLSVATANMALVFADAGFVEVISATNPLFSVAILISMGMPFNPRLLPPLCVVVIGCVLSSVGSTNFTLTGLLLVLGSNACRAIKVTLQQDLLPKGPGSKFDPCSVLAWTCLVCVAFMGAWSAAYDGLAPWRELRHHTTPKAAAFAVLISCVNACVLNLSMLFVVRSIGAVGTTVVAQTKAALTVFGSVALFNEAVSPVELLGFVAVLGGAYLYNRVDKAAPKAPKDDSAAVSVPTPEMGQKDAR